MLKKFLIGTFALAIILGGAMALAPKSEAAPQAIITVSDMQYAATVQQGSSGQAALIWQRFLNGYSTTAQLVEDGQFGLLSATQAKAWQASRGLTADGVLGAMSRAAAIAQITSGAPASAFPAGCTSTVGYSSVTGDPCAGVALPAGCTSTAGYSSSTGAKCDGSTTGTPSTGALEGGAGSIEITSTTSNVESKVKEGGDTTKVMAFKVEAVDSDVDVTNLKLVFAQTGDATSSEKLTNYVDSVDVYMGDTKVGSADASDFSRESGDTPDTYSKSIALSDAIVRDGEKATFYVEVTAVSSIDTDALTDGSDPAEWTVGATDIRYEDATGVIISGNDSLPTKSDVIAGGSATALKTFEFEDVSTDDSLDVKSSSSNPDDETVSVSDTDSTDDVLALAYKLDVGDDSADVTVNDMKLTVLVTNFDADGNGTPAAAADDIDVSVAGQWADRIISELNVKIDGTTYEADLDANVTTAQDVADGIGTLTYTVDFNGDLVLQAGETPTVEVLITFNEQSASDYNEGVIVRVSLADEDDISAETDDDDLDVGGSGKTGADLTLSLDEATISNYSWSVNSVGSIVDFFFKVVAEGNDFDVVAADILDGIAAGGTATVTNAGGDDFETSDHGILSKYSGDSVDTYGTNDGYTVAEGDTTTFRVRYSITGTNGQWQEFTITSIGGVTVPEDDQTSPTATISYN